MHDLIALYRVVAGMVARTLRLMNVCRRCDPGECPAFVMLGLACSRLAVVRHVCRLQLTASSLGRCQESTQRQSMHT
jgi:hypothetical protein